jgi:hypothetical protein
MARAICTRCAAEKELPLGRCAACGHAPDAAEAPLAVLASSRMLAPEELDVVRARLARGERLQPTPTRLAAARALLSGQPAATDPALSARQMAGLSLLALLISPLVALGASWAWRGTRAGRQALIATLVSALTEAGLRVWTAFG